MSVIDLVSLETLLQVVNDHWLILSSVFILVILYKHYTRTFTYFKDRGIQYLEPTIFLGNSFDVLIQRISQQDFFINLYQHFEGLPYGGFFDGWQPKLLIRDPELIKAVCIKDSNIFPNRNREYKPSHSCDRKNLIFLKGDEWKQARSIVTPSFSSGKLKAMADLIQHCGSQMIEVLKNRPNGETDIEMKGFAGRYTLQNIAACAFGLDAASLRDENLELLKHAHGFFKGSKLSNIMFLLAFFFYPPLGKYAPMSESSTEASKYFIKIVEKVRRQREKEKQKRRPDFLQLLLNYAETENQENPDEKVIDDLFIHGQSNFFLLAGFETTSTLLSFACHALAVHPEIQERLRKDIEKAYKENGESITYDMVHSIPYLEQVIYETLRMYPPLARIERVCVSQYTLPGTNINLEPGDTVSISISGMMSDPQYYPNPWVFDPERFNADEKSRAKEIFLTFGMGPRNCIGLRFSLMSAKFFLCCLLKDFKLSPCSKTQFPITFDKSLPLLKAEKGNWVKLEAL